MLSGAMIIWFILTGASLIFTILDFRHTPISWVQKLAWALVIAYTGPVGLFVYLLACRNPGPDMHDSFTKPMWKQAVNSEMHCLAGDASGIIIAAAVLSALALPWGWELGIEYVAAFITGLFIFQAMMMRSMFSSYGEAVRRTIFAETVSMNMVMTGMIPPMVLLAVAWPESMIPWHWSFWFRMGLATIAGGLTAYPINLWLVSKGYKHGCMTISSSSVHADPMSSHEGHSMTPHHASHEHSSHDSHEHDHMHHHDHEGQHGHNGSHSSGHMMAMPSIGEQVRWVGLTTASLAVAIIITALIR